MYKILLQFNSFLFHFITEQFLILFSLESFTYSGIFKTEFHLTLKMPRKPVSENVVCLCCLQNILANVSNLFFAYRQTVWTLIRLLLEEQSDLGPHCLLKLLLKLQADNKTDDNCCDWQFKGLTGTRGGMAAGVGWAEGGRGYVALRTTLQSYEESK